MPDVKEEIADLEAKAELLEPVQVPPGPRWRLCRHRALMVFPRSQEESQKLASGLNDARKVIEQYNKENTALVNKIHEVTSGSETHDRIIHELRTQLRSHAEKSEIKIRNERRKLEDAHERESRQAETLQAMEREREETRERMALSVQALDKARENRSRRPIQTTPQFALVPALTRTYLPQAKQEREDLLAIMQGVESKLTDCETRRYEAFQKWETTKGELEDCRIKLDTAEATAAAKTRETELMKRKMAEMGMGGFNSDSMMTLTQRSKAQGDAAVEVRHLGGLPL